MIPFFSFYDDPHTYSLFTIRILCFFNNPHSHNFDDRHSYLFVLILIGKKGRNVGGIGHEARCCGRSFTGTSAFEPAKRPLKRPKQSSLGSFSFPPDFSIPSTKNEMKSIRSQRLFRSSRRFRKHCSFKPSIDSCLKEWIACICLNTTLILITDTYITWSWYVLMEAARPKVYRYSGMILFFLFSDFPKVYCYPGLIVFFRFCSLSRMNQTNQTAILRFFRARHLQ